MSKDEAGAVYEDVLVGIAPYGDETKGQAMMETEGFAKAVIQKSTGIILGFHIIGPQAAILIQEVVNAMASAETFVPIMSGIHIHSALSELIQGTLGNLREIEISDQ